VLTVGISKPPRVQAFNQEIRLRLEGQSSKEKTEASAYAACFIMCLSSFGLSATEKQIISRSGRKDWESIFSAEELLNISYNLSEWSIAPGRLLYATVFLNGLSDHQLIWVVRNELSQGRPAIIQMSGRHVICNGLRTHVNNQGALQLDDISIVDPRLGGQELLISADAFHSVTSVWAIRDIKDPR